VDILQPPSQIELFNEVYILTELMQIDLHKIIVSQQALSIDHCKVFLYQILRGKNFLDFWFYLKALFRTEISSFSRCYSSRFEARKSFSE
jgi:hypothetical protein